MSVWLSVPSGKRRHMHTGQPKKLNKGIIYTHLDRVQRDQQVRRGTHSQEPQPRSIQGRDLLSEPRDSSFRERSPTGELVFQGGDTANPGFLWPRNAGHTDEPSGAQAGREGEGTCLRAVGRYPARCPTGTWKTASTPTNKPAL